MIITFSLQQVTFQVLQKPTEVIGTTVSAIVNMTTVAMTTMLTTMMMPNQTNSNETDNQTTGMSSEFRFLI